MSDELKPTAENQPAAPAPEAPIATGPVKDIADRNAIKPGMVIRVHQKIKEVTPEGKERERIQVFEGTVIAKKGKDAKSATITVRKVSYGVGVERIYPLMLPTIAKIEEVKRYRVRRAKLYFTRTAKKALKERK